MQQKKVLLIVLIVIILLASFAATGAMLSLFEVPVAYLAENLKMGRTKATIITALMLALIGSTAALSSSSLAGFTIFGKTMFDLYDFVSSNLLLPIGGLFIAIFAGWVWGADNIRKALSNNGQLKNDLIVNILIVIIKFVTPVLLIVVLLSGLGIF